MILPLSPSYRMDVEATLDMRQSEELAKLYASDDAKAYLKYRKDVGNPSPPVILHMGDMRFVFDHLEYNEEGYVAHYSIQKT